MYRFSVGDVVYSYPYVWRITEVVTERSYKSYSEEYLAVRVADRYGKPVKNGKVERDLYSFTDDSSSIIPVQEWLDNKIQELEEQRSSYLKFNDYLFELQNKESK